MFTDMVGYSALMGRDEPLALQLLEEHRRIVRPILAQYGGSEIKTIGDAFLVEFSSALGGATCAIEIQRILHSRNQTAPADRRIELRMGLHAGDVVHKENDVFGDGVNIASRIEPLAEPGGICVSEDVARQIQNKTGCALAKIGPSDLKNIAMPVDIYRIILPWLRPRSSLLDRSAFQLRRRSVRIALTACALGAVLGALVLRHQRTSGQPGPVNRLAVLPLVNVSAGAGEDYFADGMTEELISSLSTIRELNVIGRTSIAKFKGTRLDIAEIGSLLNVGSILEGSVRLAGDEARINVNLVDVRTQRMIWSQEYTRLTKEIFAVQSDVARNVMDALKVRLVAGERSLIERRGTTNTDAYFQFLLGRSHLNKRTPGEVEKAIESFTLAVEKDPEFALAYTGLAEGYTLASTGYGTLPRAQANARARMCAEKAVALDESLAEAHTALGYVKFRIDWDWATAEAEFKRALELKPGYSKTHEQYALFLAIRLRFDEAMIEMQLAQQLDPLNPAVSTGVGRILHFERKFDQALVQFRKTLELDPQYAEAYFGMGMSYIGLRRFDDAIGALNTAISLSGRRPVMLAVLGMAQGLAGNRAEAEKIRNEILATSKQPPEAQYCLGAISMGLRDYDQAFEHFERAFEEKDGILIYVGVDPIMESIWTDRRFVALVNKMGLRMPGSAQSRP